MLAEILSLKGLWNLATVLEPDYLKTVPPKAYTGTQAKVCKRCWAHLDQVNKIIFLWEGLCVLSAAFQHLCPYRPTSFIRAGQRLPVHSRAVLYPADMSCGLSMQWSMGKPFSVLNLSMKCFLSPTTGETAALVPQHRFGTYGTIAIVFNSNFSERMNEWKEVIVNLYNLPLDS